MSQRVLRGLDVEGLGGPHRQRASSVGLGRQPARFGGRRPTGAERRPRDRASRRVARSSRWAATASSSRGHGGEHAVIAEGVLAERGHELGGHEARRCPRRRADARGRRAAPPGWRTPELKRVRMRLPRGRSSSRRKSSAKRPSPASTTLSRARESKCALVSSRNSLRTSGGISCASSIRSTGRSSVLSRCTSHRSRRVLNPLQRLCGLRATPKRSPSSR